MADILNKLNSANYVTVKVTDNAITNGNNLLAAYALAKTRSPNGAALSTSNRLAVILPPAIYDLGVQSLILDTEFIDIIGSTTDRETHYIKSNVGVPNTGTVMQTANNVKLCNLKIQNTNTTYSVVYDTSDPAAYYPSGSLPLAYLENILFNGNDANVWSMRLIEYDGTYINCTGDLLSFGGALIGKSIGGTFKDCVGGLFSFAGGITTGGIISSNAVLTNCTGGSYSFASGDTQGGTINGTLKDCTGNDYSFASSTNLAGTINGTLTNCTAEVVAFAGGSTGGTIGTLAVLTNCNARDYSFAGGYSQGGTINGTLLNCNSRSYSFAGGGPIGGIIGNTAILTNCNGEFQSFAGSSSTPGTINGKITNCKGNLRSFNL